MKIKEYILFYSFFPAQSPAKTIQTAPMEGAAHREAVVLKDVDAIKATTGINVKVSCWLCTVDELSKYKM